VFDYSNKKHPKMIAFLMPNEKNLKGKIMDYAMSVRELENKTGLDFFKNMPRKTQDYLETYVKKSEWQTYD
jgi:endonuclease G